MPIQTGQDILAADVLALKFNTQSVVTGSRVLGTIYQNTSGKPMLVIVSALCIYGGAATGDAYIEAVTDASATPATTVARGGLVSQGGAATHSHTSTITFIVLAGNYYKVVKAESGSGNSVALSIWTEYSY